MLTGRAKTESGVPRRVARFAAFEFDLGTGELRKHGLRIKLNGQPVDVLTMLIEHAGEVVTREELQKRLWASDTYVDFEHSLNAAIKRLRAALGDSADAPRFVETLARQGYRFIAPLSPPVVTQAAESASGRPVVSTPRPARCRRRGLGWSTAGSMEVAARSVAQPAVRVGRPAHHQTGCAAAGEPVRRCRAGVFR